MRFQYLEQTAYSVCSPRSAFRGPPSAVQSLQVRSLHLSRDQWYLVNNVSNPIQDFLTVLITVGSQIRFHIGARGSWLLARGSWLSD